MLISCTRENKGNINSQEQKGADIWYLIFFPTGPLWLLHDLAFPSHYIQKSPLEKISEIWKVKNSPELPEILSEHFQ